MIRKATRYDIPRILEMVEAYAYEMPIKCLSDVKNHNAQDVEQMLFEIIMGRGFILIDTHMTGILIALKNKNIWCKTVTELNELLWWVEPEHRNGTIGGRLWKEFDRLAEEMLKEGTIQMVVTSVSPMGPMIDYTKRGYSIFGASFFRE